MESYILKQVLLRLSLQPTGAETQKAMAEVAAVLVAAKPPGWLSGLQAFLAQERQETRRAEADDAHLELGEALWKLKSAHFLWIPPFPLPLSLLVFGRSSFRHQESLCPPHHSYPPPGGVQRPTMPTWSWGPLCGTSSRTFSSMHEQPLPPPSFPLGGRLPPFAGASRTSVTPEVLVPQARFISHKTVLPPSTFSLPSWSLKMLWLCERSEKATPTTPPHCTWKLVSSL